MLKRYHRLVSVLIVLLVSYSLVGSFTWRRLGVEWYPIFAWDLFSQIPNTLTDYGLRITYIRNAPLTEPLYFEQATELFSDAQSIVANSQIQSLGVAIQQGNQEAVQQLSTTINERYLQSEEPLRYEIVKRTWKPLDRYYNGSYIAEEVIATFELNTQ